MQAHMGIVFDWLGGPKFGSSKVLKERALTRTEQNPPFDGSIFGLFCACQKCAA